MKKIALIAAAALVTIAASAQDFKLGYVDTSEITELMPEMDSARVQLDAAQKEAQETFQAMVDEYQSKAQQYEQKQSSWTPAIAQSKANELQQIMGRIQEFEQAIQQDLMMLENSLKAPIYTKAQKAIEEVAKSNGVATVFMKSSLLYIDQAQMIDLTPEVRVLVGIPEGRTLETLQAEMEAKAQAAQMQ